MSIKYIERVSNKITNYTYDGNTMQLNRQDAENAKIKAERYTLTSVMDKKFACFSRQMLKHPAPFSGGKGAEAH